MVVKNPDFKIRHWIDISSKKIQKWPRSIWKDAQRSALSHQEMQVPTTVRYHFIPTSMGRIKKADSNKCWGCGGTGISLCCWWESTMVQPLWKTAWQFLRKLSLGTSLAVQWLGLDLPMQGMQVRSLVGELRSHVPRGQKAKTLKQKQYCNKFNKDF